MIAKRSGENARARLSQRTYSSNFVACVTNLDFDS